jgi:hypothetical protein
MLTRREHEHSYRLDSLRVRLQSSGSHSPIGQSVGVQLARKAVCFEPSVSTGAAAASEGRRANALKIMVWRIIFEDLDIC